jgi:hypothetical protein
LSGPASNTISLRNLNLSETSGGNEKVQLSERKRRGVAFRRIAVKGYVAEPPYIKQSLVHIHSHGLTMFGWRLGLGCSGRARWRRFGSGGWPLAGFELRDTRLKLIDSSHKQLNHLLVGICRTSLLRLHAPGHEHRNEKHEGDASSVLADNPASERILGNVDDGPRRGKHHFLPPKAPRVSMQKNVP